MIGSYGYCRYCGRNCGCTATTTVTTFCVRDDWAAVSTGPYYTQRTFNARVWEADPFAVALARHRETVRQRNALLRAPMEPAPRIPSPIVAGMELRRLRASTGLARGRA